MRKKYMQSAFNESITALAGSSRSEETKGRAIVDLIVAFDCAR